jgi:Skp family chaperone for outer membrane proteins
MRVFQIFTKSVVFILIFSALAFAQTEKVQSPTLNKISFIDSEAFDDKETGIKELVAVYDKLEIEFKPQVQEIISLIEEIKRMQKEFEVSPGYVRISAEVINNKLKEYDLAAAKLKSWQEEAKTLYEKRESEQTAGIKKKIAQAVDLFAKEKGYKLIFMISKSNEPAILAKSEDADVTSEFIKYYNENFAKTETY